MFGEHVWKNPLNCHVHLNHYLLLFVDFFDDILGLVVWNIFSINIGNSNPN